MCGVYVTGRKTAGPSGIGALASPNAGIDTYFLLLPNVLTTDDLVPREDSIGRRLIPCGASAKAVGRESPQFHPSATPSINYPVIFTELANHHGLARVN